MRFVQFKRDLKKQMWESSILIFSQTKFDYNLWNTEPGCQQV